jgi:hypothetical protein
MAKEHFRTQRLHDWGRALGNLTDRMKDQPVEMLQSGQASVL